MAINKVILLGTLVRDMEIKEIKPGLSLGKFTVLCVDVYKKKDGSSYNETVYVDCSLWGNTLEEYKNFKLDDVVFVEGRLKAEKWTDKMGMERYKLTVKADKVEQLKNSHDHDRTFDDLSNKKVDQIRTFNKTDSNGEFQDELPF